jgi:hypothetical protein
MSQDQSHPNQHQNPEQWELFPWHQSSQQRELFSQPSQSNPSSEDQDPSNRSQDQNLEP